MAYPISRGRFINFCAFEIRPHEEGTHFGGPWVVDMDPSYVASLFQGWEKDVSDLIQVRVQSANEELKHRTLDTYDIPYSAWVVYGYLVGQSTSFHLCRSTPTET
jgi:hypothetical protein